MELLLPVVILGEVVFVAELALLAARACSSRSRSCGKGAVALARGGTVLVVGEGWYRDEKTASWELPNCAPRPSRICGRAAAVMVLFMERRASRQPRRRFIMAFCTSEYLMFMSRAWRMSLQRRYPLTMQNI